MAAVIGNASGDAQGSAPGYADALQRAREIAAKIQPDIPGPMGDYSQKRPLEDAEEPGAKKLASQNDLSAQLGAMQQAQLQQGGRPTLTETFNLPDKLVGLVIGKKGENISRLQAETGCRVQISQECQGNDERPCTLTGTPEQITICRNLLQDMVNKGKMGGPDNIGTLQEMSGGGAQTVIQMMIPPDKCGLVIGKRGETIITLQKTLGVKMMLIQDTTQNTGSHKPLRISGDPMKVEQAKQAVEQKMAQHDAAQAQMQQRGGGAPGGRNFNDNMGQQQQSRISIPVPKPAVGVVIGKGGDTINRIQAETRTRVQFRQEDEDPNVPHRMCNISGSHEGVQAAIGQINELIQSVHEHDNTGGPGPGFGPGRGRGRGGGGFGQWEGPGMGRGRPGPGINTEEFNVPANKTGLVIGKGGESIRQINQQSQAHVEIQRIPPPGSDPNFKTFIIKGSQEQISLAKQLIMEKVEGQQSSLGGPGPMPMGPPGGPPPGGPPGAPGGFGPPPPQGNFGGPPPGPGFGGPPQGPPQHQQQPPQQFPGQQPWGGAPNQFQWPQPGAPQQNGAPPAADPGIAKPPDANAAAWAGYYNYIQSQSQQPAQVAAAAAAAAYQQSAAATPGVVPGAAAGAQPDYTKAWEEWYKKQAEAAAAAAAGTPVAAVPSAAAVAPAAPQPAATTQASAGGPDYSAAWAEYYRQYYQTYQQAQAQQYPGGVAAPAAPGQ